MPRLVRAGLIQAGVGMAAPSGIQQLKKFMIDKHESMIEQAAGEGVVFLCTSPGPCAPKFCGSIVCPTEARKNKRPQQQP